MRNGPASVHRAERPALRPQLPAGARGAPTAAGIVASMRRSSTCLLLLLLLLVGVVPPARADDAAPPDLVGQGVWPLRPEPEVVASFRPPSAPWGPGHRGVDLAGSVAQPVGSALPGRVAYAGRLAGRGVVTVDHGETRTTYQPVRALVAVGDVVAAGGRIGTLELDGSHCFPRACLHWGWIRQETYLDPLLLVGGGPVRLLPLWSDSPLARATRTSPSLPVPGRQLGRGDALSWRLPLPYAGWLTQALG